MKLSYMIITIFDNHYHFMIRIINDTKEDVTKMLRHIFCYISNFKTRKQHQGRLRSVFGAVYLVEFILYIQYNLFLVI